MRFLKPDPHLDYKSKDIIIFKTKNIKIELSEHYDPHWLDIDVWVRDKNTHLCLFTLKHWYKIPLNRYSRILFKISKYEYKVEKYKAKLSKLDKQKVETMRAEGTI